MIDPIEAAVRAYAEKKVLAQRRERADRGDLHPGDICHSMEGDVQILMQLINREAMKAAIEAAESARS